MRNASGGRRCTRTTRRESGRGDGRQRIIVAAGQPPNLSVRRSAETRFASIAEGKELAHQLVAGGGRCAVCAGYLVRVHGDETDGRRAVGAVDAVYAIAVHHGNVGGGGRRVADTVVGGTPVEDRLLARFYAVVDLAGSGGDCEVGLALALSLRLRGESGSS